MSRGVRWFLIGSAALVTLAGCGRGYLPICASASRGGARPKSPASTPAPSRKAPASSASRRSRAPACAAPTFRSRSRRWAKARRMGFGDEPMRPPGSIPGASRPAPQPRWPISQQPYPRRAAQSRRADVDRSARHASCLSAAAIPQQQCSARRRPICRRRRTGSAATGQPGLQSGAVDAAAARRRSKRSMTEELPPYARPGAAPMRAAADRAAVPRLCRRSARRAIRSGRGHADRGQAHGHARVPDRVGARSLVRQRGAAGGAASGSTSRWSRSSRSRPIPAAA